MNDALTASVAPPPTPLIAATPVARSRADLLAVASLALIVTISFADVLVGVNNFYMRDLTRYYYPTKQLLRDIVYGGEFPYWNPYFSAGQPIAANPEHEVFYPLTWLILLPSYDFGFRMLILVHLYIGLFGMYALLRSMDLRIESAWFGAMSFALGGLYLSYINLLPILFCAAWLPLTCLYVRRFLLHRGARNFGIASIFLGLQFLVGEPTTVMQTGLLIGLYALYRAWYSPRRFVKSITGVLWIALLSITAIGIGAAQSVPAIDHVHDSARSRPFEFDLVSAWSMPWAKFAELIFPNILGHISIKQVMWYWGGGLYPGMGSPFLFSIYSGVAMVALLAGGAMARPRGGRLVLIICAISAALALGGHTPLLKELYRAGIATAVRYPEKFALCGLFAAIVFASQMLDRLLEGDETVRDGSIGFAAAITFVAVVIAVSGFTPYYRRAFMYVWALTSNAGATYEIKVSRMDWLIAAGRGAALLLLLLTLRKLKPAIWTVAAAIFLIADLTLCTFELNPRMPQRFYDPSAAANELPRNRGDYRLFHEADWYGQEEIARQYFSTGSAVYWIVRNGLFPMTPAGVRVRTAMERDYDKTALLPTVDFTDSVWDVKRAGRGDWWQPFMSMSNAWYRAVYRPFDAEKKRVGGNFKAAMPMRFIAADHAPRYYFADQVISIHGRGDFVKKLTEGSYSSKVAFVAQPGFVPASGDVLHVSETANTATLDVDSRGQGFLVMSVTPHKYWRIFLDGVRVPAVVTNIGYQGIVVTPGRHRVVMLYRNELVLVGAAVSIVATIITLLLIIFGSGGRPPDAVPAYEEPIHVVADPGGAHIEPANI